MSDLPYSTVVPQGGYGGNTGVKLAGKGITSIPGVTGESEQIQEIIETSRPGGYFGMGGGRRQRQRRRQTQRHRRYRKVLKPYRSRSRRSGHRAVIH